MAARRPGFNPLLIIPRVFQECFTYTQQVAWLHREIEELKERIQKLEEKGEEDNV